MTEMRQRVLSGLGWSGTTRFLQQGLQFVISVILARLLGPREFGLVGMVLVFTGFASVLCDMGLGASLIQRQQISDRHLNAVFWVNVSAGTLLTLLFGLAAPLIAAFYDEPVLRWLTSAIALNFLLGSLSVVQDALLTRSLNFRTKFWIESVSLLVSALVAVFLAFSGAGVWSLVGQSITATAVRVGMMWGLSSWRPSMSFDPSTLRDLMGFGGNLMASNIVLYWGQNFDKLIIARSLGSTALGIYNLADKVMRLSLSNVTDITGAVMFPALSMMQDEIASVKRTYLRAVRLIALVTFPMMVGLSVLAEPAILVVYGDKWREAISLVQILCLAGMVQSVYFTGGWLFLSRGRTDLLFRWGAYVVVVRAAGAFLGVQWGLAGVACAYVAGSCVFIGYPNWASAGRLVNIRFAELLRHLRGPFYCAVAMGALLWTVDRWILGGQGLVMRLILQVLLGVVFYGGLIRRVRLEAWEDLRRIIADLGGERSGLVRWLVGSSPPAKP